jgi:Clathrin, heavy-chain linker.
MSFSRLLLGKLAASTFLVLVTGAGAQAQDAAAVAERFKAVLGEQGVEMTWASISGSSPSFALQGVKVTPTGETDALEIGEVTFEGVSEDNGDYVIEKMSTESFSKTEEGITVDISPLSFTGVRLPVDHAANPVGSMLFYSGAELDNITVKVGDKTAFSLQTLSAEVTPPADGKPMTFTGSAEKFTADLSLIEDAQTQNALKAMGYQTITGNFELAGTWQPTDGRMSLDQYDITVDDAGTFGMTFDIGGYTTNFVKSMQELQKQLATQPDDADNSAQGLAMLGLMQQLTFHGASLRWDDDSLAEKVIDYVAKLQNMKPDDIKNQAKAIVPFLTGQLNNPELSSQITSALSKFLDSPQSLEVAAKPSAAVPFAQIMAAGMSDPLQLTKTLGVTVTANQD